MNEVLQRYVDLALRARQQERETEDATRVEQCEELLRKLRRRIEDSGIQEFCDACGVDYGRAEFLFGRPPMINVPFEADGELLSISLAPDDDGYGLWIRAPHHHIDQRVYVGTGARDVGEFLIQLREMARRQLVPSNS